MKRLAAPSMLAGLLVVGAVPAHAEFTGDVKLACEAILCLSSGQRPDECAPSLDRYFGIKKKKLSDTLEARRDFLNECPSASHDNNMRSLVKAIANGAGRCDASFLNRTLSKQIERQVCPSNRWGWSSGEDCYIETITIIDNAKPSYCVTYDGHGYTFQVGVSYIGDPMNGGHWE